MSDEKEPLAISIHDFRYNVVDDLSSLHRIMICNEQTLERLTHQAQQLTIQKYASLQEEVYPGKSITHFTAQRELLLLGDKVSAIVASFKHGKLAQLLDEGQKHIIF